LGTSSFPYSLDALRRRAERGDAFDPSGNDWNLVVDAILALETSTRPASLAANIGSSVIIPPGSLTPWQTAKAAALAGTGAATVWSAGASTAQGGSAVTNVISKSTFAQWRQAQINAGYPTGGDFFISTYSSNWSGNNAPNGWPFTNNIAPAGWLADGPWWVPNYTATAVTLATPELSYVHPSTDLGYNARSFRVYYFDGGTQDGGAGFAAATFKYNTAASESGATTVTLLGDNLIHSFDIVSQPNSAGNAIYFGNQSSASCMKVIGVLCCPGTALATTGMFYCRVGQPSHTMADLMTTAGTYPADKISRYIGPAGATAPFTPNAALAPPFLPHLVLQEPLDDVAFIPPGTLTVGAVTPATAAIHGVPADAYLWGLERMADAFRRNPAGCTVVHELPNYSDGYTSDTSLAALYATQNWGDYFDAHIKIAARYGHIVSNTNINWGELALTYGYIAAGNPHPNDAGSGFNGPAGAPASYLNVQPRAARWQEIGL
jgi:hypothetical protein